MNYIASWTSAPLSEGETILVPLGKEDSSLEEMGLLELFPRLGLPFVPPSKVG